MRFIFPVSNEQDRVSIDQFVEQVQNLTINRIKQNLLFINQYCIIDKLC